MRNCRCGMLVEYLCQCVIRVGDCPSCFTPVTVVVGGRGVREELVNLFDQLTNVLAHDVAVSHKNLNALQTKRRASPVIMAASRSSKRGAEAPLLAHTSEISFILRGSASTMRATRNEHPGQMRQDAVLL